MIEALLAQHGRAALMFSGGKDSLATLLLLRPYWDRLDVVWSNPGAPYPETVAYMADIAARVPHFHEVTGEQPAWIARHGWPADTVPARQTHVGANHAGAKAVYFQPYFSCCNHNMWQPLQNFVARHQHTLVITGQRRSEALRNRSRDEMVQDIDGLTYFQPLNAWGEARVLSFLDELGEPLPPFYAQGATSSSDCWNCTAYLDHNQARLSHMRTHDPVRWQTLSGVFQALDAGIQETTAPLSALLAPLKD